MTTVHSQPTQWPTVCSPAGLGLDYIYTMDQNRYKPNGDFQPYSTQSVKEIYCVINMWLNTNDPNDPNPGNPSPATDVAGPHFMGPNGVQIIPALHWVIDRINASLADVAPPTHPIYPLSYYSITDTRIKLVLKHIAFIPDPAMYNNPDCGELAVRQMIDVANTWYSQQGIFDTKGMIHLNINGALACPGNSIGVATGPRYAHYDVFDELSMNGAGVKTVKTFGNNLWLHGAFHLAKHWQHEIGHVLGLHHTYNISPTEFCSGSEFLYDVFLPPFCPTPVGNTLGGCIPDPQVVNGCTNNIMGGTGNNYVANQTGIISGIPLTVPPDYIPVEDPMRPDFVSPLQMGRMHRALATSNIGRFVREGYNGTPYVISTNEEWVFPRKMYQNIIIPSGYTLTLYCQLFMVPESRIIVEPGGRLILDGGIIDTAPYSNMLWQGVEVRGNPSMDQSPMNGIPTDQGYLEMRNGAEIRNAVIGALIGDSDNVLPHWHGGVIKVFGTHNNVGGKFTNCQRGVVFEKYQWFSGQVMLLNASRFINAEFSYDSDALQGYPMRTHVELHRMGNVRFAACKFKDDRNVTYVSELGTGITSYDARFDVRDHCLTQDGGPCVVTRSHFEGLRRGVYVNTSAYPMGFYVQRSDFVNNVCGIYNDGVAGAINVQHNSFTIGGRNVIIEDTDDEGPWQNRHRGVFSTYSWGLGYRHNTLSKQTGALVDVEGIVAGYVGDHNDNIQRNDANGINYGYIGEGISSATTGDDVNIIGLQFTCNHNNGNQWDLISRKAFNALPAEQLFHSIRGYQGLPQIGVGNGLSAQNYLDVQPTESDGHFRVETDLTQIQYFHRNEDPVIPENYTPGLFAPIALSNGITNCPVTPPPPPPGPSPAKPQLKMLVQSEKLAYGNTRYLYEQLIDGGNTDEVVQEIISAWPQDVWDLRDYLLSKSPYLSVTSLRELIMKPGVPDAIKAEICIANPAATRTDGFVPWLQREQLLPEYLIGSIVASWDQRGYREALIGEMAGRHFNMTQAANELIDIYCSDSTGIQLDSLLWTWRQVRTKAARYAEAALLITLDRYDEAHTVVSAIPQEHELRPKELDERGRMLEYITLLSNAAAAGRAADALDAGEVAQLQNLISGENDRAANWISNLLCNHYGICRPAFTGGGSSDPKSMPVVRSAAVPVRGQISIHPNPASAWVAVDHQLVSIPLDAWLELRDVTGRLMQRHRIGTIKGQIVLDTRNLVPGVYMVEIREGGNPIAEPQKLIIEQ